MAKNKKWSSAAKFEIALLAIKNDTPLNEICKKYEVSPSQVHAWKKQLLEEGNASEITSYSWAINEHPSMGVAL